MDWNGYPQHSDAHPERPWWRGRHYEWRRSDGVTALFRAELGGAWLVSHPGRSERGTLRDAAGVAVFPQLSIGECGGDILRHVDRLDPLPPPPPKCGQVWQWPSGFSATIQAVDPTGMCDPGGPLGQGSRPGVVWPCTVPAQSCATGRYVAGWTDRGLWPLRRAVLVAGPGAPWAPSEGGK